MLIYEILKKSVVEKKDIPDYIRLKNKNCIYISRTYYSKFFGGAKNEVVEFQFEDNEIPNQIADVQFLIKSNEELQKIAFKTSDFLYLTIGQIEIKDTIATIGISTSLQTKRNHKIVDFSGGGYLLQYTKINGIWHFEKVLTEWNY